MTKGQRALVAFYFVWTPVAFFGYWVKAPPFDWFAFAVWMTLPMVALWSIAGAIAVVRWIRSGA